jgi:hypothetical protein
MMVVASNRATEPREVRCRVVPAELQCLQQPTSDQITQFIHLELNIAPQGLLQQK